MARPKGDLRNDLRCGFEIIKARDIDRYGIAGIIEKLMERVSGTKVYISVDIDVLVSQKIQLNYSGVSLHKTGPGFCTWYVTSLDSPYHSLIARAWIEFIVHIRYTTHTTHCATLD
jgi:hypothetical protein